MPADRARRPRRPMPDRCHATWRGRRHRLGAAGGAGGVAGFIGAGAAGFGAGIGRGHRGDDRLRRDHVATGLRPPVWLLACGPAPCGLPASLPRSCGQRPSLPAPSGQRPSWPGPCGRWSSWRSLSWPPPDPSCGRYAPTLRAVLRTVRAAFLAILRGLVFLLVVRFFPLALVAMVSLRFCSVAALDRLNGRAYLRESRLHLVQACRPRWRVNLFLSLYADRDRKCQRGGAISHQYRHAERACCTARRPADRLGAISRPLRPRRR